MTMRGTLELTQFSHGTRPASTRPASTRRTARTHAITHAAYMYMYIYMYMYMYDVYHTAGWVVAKAVALRVICLPRA